MRGDSPQTRDLLQLIRQRVGAQGRMAGRACMHQQDAQTSLAAIPGMDPDRCRVERLRLAGDRASLVLACNALPDGSGRSRMEIVSTFAGDSRTIETSGTINMTPGPGAAPRDARLVSTVRMRRVGDCPPGQAPAGNAPSRP